MRRFLQGVALVVAGLILCAACLLVVLQSDWFHQQLKGFLVSRIEEVTGGKVQIGSVQVRWPQLELQLTDFVLRGKEPPEQAAFISIAGLRVRFRVASAMRREIGLEELYLQQPGIHLVVYADGTTNIPQPSRKRPLAHPVEELVALAIRQLTLQDGQLQVNDRRLPLNLTARNVTARLFYEQAGPRYRGRVTFGELRLAGQDYPLPPLKAALSLAIENDRIVAEDLELKTAQSSMRLSGVLSNWANPVLTASLHGLFEVGELIPSRAQSRLVGPIALQGALQWAGDKGVSGEFRLTGDKLQAESAGLRVPFGQVSADVSLENRQILIRRFRAAVLGGFLEGEGRLDQWKHFSWAGRVEGLSTQQLARLRNLQLENLDGRLSGPIHLTLELGPGLPRLLAARTELTVEASAGDRPVAGLVAASWNQQSRAMELRDSWLATQATRLQTSGSLPGALRVFLQTSDLDEVAEIAALLSPAVPRPPLPLKLSEGSARFTGELSGSLDNPTVTGNLILTNLAWSQFRADRLEATLTLRPDSLSVPSFKLSHAAATFQGRASLSLQEWRPHPGSTLKASLKVRSLPLQHFLEEARFALPLKGRVDGELDVAGTLATPEVKGRITGSRFELYGESIDRLEAQLSLQGRKLQVPSASFKAGSSRLEAELEFEASPHSWREGFLHTSVRASIPKLSQFQLARRYQKLDGQLVVNLQAHAGVAGELQLRSLAGRFELRQLQMNGNLIGELTASARTSGGAIEVEANGALLHSPVQMTAQVGLGPGMPAAGELRFGSIALSTLQKLASARTGKEPSLPLDAVASGRLAFSGAARDVTTWKGRLELDAVDVWPAAAQGGEKLRLQAQGPVVVAFSRRQALVQSARFSGNGTQLQVSGRVLLLQRGPEADLRLVGSVNLAVLQNFRSDLLASGSSEIDLTIKGPFTNPDAYGRVILREASLALRGIPNVLEDVSGQILIFRDRATIESFSARTGGGTLRLTGFVGRAGGHLFYQLKTEARQVRIRYPEGVSTTFDAALELRGTTVRGVLSGSASISRASLSPEFDLSSLLSRPAQPLVPPALPNPFLSGLQLDVSIRSSTNARFENFLARNLQAEVDLRLQGTLYRPLLLGNIAVHQGEIDFLGNRYRISRGSILFANPVRLEPVLDFDLYTRVRGVDVTMNFTGPATKLNLTYRSDPPLQVNEIIALLAVGRAPISDPALLARQTERDQTWQQMSANTLLGTALETLERGRLQRFFGVSRLKIDPKLTGLGNIPEAQLTLEQQVSRDITLTYVTKLAQEQQQLVRVEWNLGRQWSLLAVRDENGLFGIEIQFRRQFK